ncbi:MAG: asparagine synthase (glutamine-hydrolyzing) [bacterium]
MCGIAGIFRYADAEGCGVDQRALQNISAHMQNRGPDDQGLWVSRDGSVALAHRRLAIIDPGPEGHQPMRCRFGDHVITFNGEIYNFQILRKQLIEHGHRFTTESDTEVLLRLYQHYGQAMVEHLRGMYAFAIWDPHLGGLFMARDPYGIKPLYYAVKDGEIRFASQVKALIRGGGISPEKSVAAEAGFLLTGSVMEPNTLYRDICCLPAGHQLWVDDAGPSAPSQYFDVAKLFFSDRASNSKVDNQSSTTDDAFRDSVEHHLIADVPVGAFLSAGVDSTAITGIAAELGGSSLKAVTLGFEEYRGTSKDETGLAAEVAASIGARHSVRYVTHSEFDQDFDHILTAMDQPTIDGINTWFVSKAAAEQGLKVMLSGIGGDELLGSYPSFKDIPLWRRRFGWLENNRTAAGIARYAAAHIKSLPVSPKVFGMPIYAGTWGGGYLLRRGLFMPWELPAIMGRERAEAGLATLDIPGCFEPRQQGGSSYSLIAAMESGWYLRNQLLRDADWASMAHSVEVRTPLVDINLTARTAPIIAANPGKHWLSKVPRQSLPERVLDRAKTGFTLPISDWLKQNSRLDHWKQHRALREGYVHWSRRYAVCLHALFFE